MQMHVETGRVIAGCFALAAFTVAVVSGLASDNGTAQILLRAVLAMILCYPVGLVAGMVCERVVRAHIDAPQVLSVNESESPRASIEAPALMVNEEPLDPTREETRAAA